jgi:hypothetical protein
LVTLFSFYFCSVDNKERDKIEIDEKSFEMIMAAHNRSVEKVSIVNIAPLANLVEDRSQGTMNFHFCTFYDFKALHL